MILRLLGLLLLACTGIAMANPSAHDAAISATDCQPMVFPVMAARSADGKRPQQGWETVTLPDTWSKRWPGHDGSVWYRIDWQRSCGEVALMVDSIVMAGELFINGQRFWQDRHLVEPLSRSWAMARYWQLPEALLMPDHNHLEFRVVGVASAGAGLGVVALDSPEKIHSLYQATRWHARTLPLLNLVVTIFLGCLVLGAWLVWRNQRVFGWYALVAMGWALLSAHILTTDTWPYPDSLAFARGHNLVYLLYSAGFCIFTWSLLQLPVPVWLERGLALLVLLGVAVILLSPGWPGLQRVGNLTALLLFINNLGVIFWALGHRHTEALVVAICLLLVILVGTRDVLVLKGSIESRIFLLHYTGLIFLVAAAILLGRRALSSARRVERFNEELQGAMQQARHELNSSLQSEHQLALINLRHEARQQLAHDLHDGLGGQIARSILLVDQAAEPPAKSRVLSLLKLLRDDLRQVIDAGTSETVSAPATPAAWALQLRHRFVSLFDELGIRLHWQLPSAWISQPSALQGLLLARVVEEALTNVLKHSQATEAAVILEQATGASLQLIIEDNGCGFDTQLTRQQGLGVGLISMRARVERLEGQLQLSASGAGTRLVVHLPLVGA